MFIFNFKLPKKTRAAVLVSVSGILVAMLCIGAMLSIFRSTVPDVAVCERLGEYSLKADSKQDRLSFFESIGQSADMDSEVCDEVTIPYEFDEVYTKYNQLQQGAGLDLERYKGRQVKRYRYELENSEYSYAVLLVYSGRVIGGHLTNGEYGGGMKPLV